MPNVTRTQQIAAPPSAVWRWFTTQDALRRWLSATIEIDLAVGGSYRMLGADGETTISGTVLELVPEGRLVLSWLEQGAGWAHPGRLVLELSATSGGTLVTLTHDGFAGIGRGDWPRVERAYERGADQHAILTGLATVATAYAAQ